MIIRTKKELDFFIAADRIMNGRPAKRGFKEVLVYWIARGGVIIRYLRAMRKYAYYANTTKNGQLLRSCLRLYWGRRFRGLGLRLGFSIGHNSLGYGVKIPHYGTIVVNGEAVVGNFAVLHTCTCIAGKKVIGDYLYLSTGSQITGNIELGDGITVAAHSLVNQSSEGHILLAGAPAEVKKKDYPLWPDRDGEQFVKQISKVIKLKDKMLS